MSPDRRQQLLRLLGPRGDDQTSFLRRICDLTVSETAVSGAAVSVMGQPGAPNHYALVCATDATSMVLDDLRLTTGVGPTTEAFTSGGPVLVSDLAASGSRWPGFTAEACDSGVAAVFSFPLQIGAVRIGVLELHRSTAGPLPDHSLNDVLTLADIATHIVLTDLDDGGGLTDVRWLSDIHAVVHQASGIVAVQLSLSVRDALLRVRAHAFANRTPLNEVARRIVTRELRLETES
jgi:hypothetical protein